MTDSPASSVSAALSWGAYLIAAVSLVGAFVPALNGVYSSSDASAGATLVSGVARVLNSLHPGMSVRFAYSAPSGETIALSGHQISLRVQQGTIVNTCTWNLPDTTLEAGRQYIFTLGNSGVEVRTDV